MENAPSSTDAISTVAPPAVVSSWMQPMKKPSTVGGIAWLSPLVEKMYRSMEQYAAALWERQGCTTIPWNDKPLALLLRIVLIAMLWTFIAMSQR
jgi:hypothetical protein